MDIIPPESLAHGMTIGIIAPSGPVDPDSLNTAISRIKTRGYSIKLGAHLFDRLGFLAGKDEDRASDLNNMLADPNVDAIFCARGGYGAGRILDRINWSHLAARPRIFCGYSDITILHLAIERTCGIVTFHGPMAQKLDGSLPQPSEDCFWNMMELPTPYGVYDCTGDSVKTLYGGIARGRLSGGCLSLLTAAMGTKEEPDFRGKIVVIEDVGENVYRVDRMLLQMERAGLLQQSEGFIIGDVTDCPDKQQPISLLDIWRERIAKWNKPAIVGFPFGHTASPYTIPLGCTAELNADDGTLTVLEPAVKGR
jgi:muramoyltetrapeptide carboxypeptidase